LRGNVGLGPETRSGSAGPAAFLVYLSGAIEYAPDSGKGWRESIAPFLSDDLGHRVYDPAHDSRKSLTAEEWTHFRSWKTTDFPRFRAAVRKIVDYDLEVVSRSDYLICYWDEHSIRGGGTAAEVTWAYRLKKPVYLVSPLPVPHVSGWVLACCSEHFGSFEDLKVHLRQVYRRL